jgi:hypothetical protein
MIRGAAVVAMIPDHIGGAGSWLYTVTGGDRFFISAAEAFVAISGFVMGSVNTDLIAREGMSAALMRIFKRAWMLYTLTLALTLAFALTATALGLWWRPVLSRQGWADFAVGLVTLHQGYYLTDVPLLYTLLVLAAGPLLVLLANGRWHLVLAGSWLLWLVWQRWPAQAQVPWTIAYFPTFNLAAWQVLFVTCLVLGYYRRPLAQLLTNVPLSLVLACSGTVFALAIAVHLRGVSASGQVLGSAYTVEQLFGKADLGPGRLIVFAAFAVWLYSVLTVLWTPLKRALSWLLLPLGEHALSAYMVHLFVVAVFTAATAHVRPTWENTLVQAAAVLVVWSLIVLRTPAARQVHRLVQPSLWLVNLCARIRALDHAHGETPRLTPKSAAIDLAVLEPEGPSEECQ